VIIKAIIIIRERDRVVFLEMVWEASEWDFAKKEGVNVR